MRELFTNIERGRIDAVDFLLYEAGSAAGEDFHAARPILF